MPEEYQLKIDEGQRQMMLLALAELALSRPGWDMALQMIAEKMDNPGQPTYLRMKQLNADRVAVERMPLMSLVAEQDEEEIQRWVYGVLGREENSDLERIRYEEGKGRAGGFLSAFVQAALRADGFNYALMRPVIVALKLKYPSYKYEGKL
jgi:hypothetical protein